MILFSLWLIWLRWVVLVGIVWLLVIMLIMFFRWFCSWEMVFGLGMCFFIVDNWLLSLCCLCVSVFRLFRWFEMNFIWLLMFLISFLMLICLMKLWILCSLVCSGIILLWFLCFSNFFMCLVMDMIWFLSIIMCFDWGKVVNVFLILLSCVVIFLRICGFRDV